MYPKTIIFSSLLALIPFLLFSQQWEWARQAGGSGVDHGQQVAVSNDGSIYLTGTFSGTAYFGEDTLVSKGKKDVFVSRYSVAGELLWTIGFGTGEMDFSYDIEAGQKGGVLVTGNYTDTLQIENVTLTTVDGHDIFLAKFSRQGKIQWAKTMGGKGFDASFGIETDAGGNIYQMNTLDYNPLDSLSHSDKEYNTLEIAKLNSGGGQVWSFRTEGRSRIFGNALSIDNSGNLYLTGEYKGEVIYRTDTLNARYGIFVLKINNDGDLIWQKTLGSDHIRSFGADLVPDDEGSLYLTGGFEGIGEFGTDIMSSLGNLDIFVASLDASNGSINWIERAGGERMDKGMGLCLAKDGFLVTGWYEGWAHFGYDTTVVANGGNDFFIAKYNKAGQLTWIDAPISKGLGYGKAIKGDGRGNYVCTGWFTGVMNFPSDLLVGTTRPDIYIAKFRDEEEE